MEKEEKGMKGEGDAGTSFCGVASGLGKTYWGIFGEQRLSLGAGGGKSSGDESEGRS